MEERMSLLPVDASEEQVIELWLKRKQSQHTKRNYRRSIDAYKLFLQKPAIESTVMDLQGFLEDLQARNLSRNTQKVTLDIVKSYLTFAHKTGFSRVNVGAAFGAIKRRKQCRSAASPNTKYRG